MLTVGCHHCRRAGDWPGQTGEELIGHPEQRREAPWEARNLSPDSRGRRISPKQSAGRVGCSEESRV